MTEAQQIVTAALLRARSEGDAASAAELERLLGEPQEAAALIKHLVEAKPTGAK